MSKALAVRMPVPCAGAVITACTSLAAAARGYGRGGAASERDDGHRCHYKRGLLHGSSLWLGARRDQADVDHNTRFVVDHEPPAVVRDVGRHRRALGEVEVVAYETRAPATPERHFPGWAYNARGADPARRNGQQRALDLIARGLVPVERRLPGLPVIRHCVM